MLPEAQRYQPHFHHLHEILFVTEGTAEFNVNGKRYLLEKGSLLFISNLEPHSIYSKSLNYKRYSLQLSNDFFHHVISDPLLLSIMKQRPENFCHKIQCPTPIYNYINKLFARCLEESNSQNDYWDIMISDALADFIVTLFRMDASAFPASSNLKGQNVVQSIQAYIESHIDEDLSLESVAEKYYISKFHLSHIFKDLTGYNFKRFIVLTRLSKAKYLLLNTDDSINRIAKAVGFNNTTHFIRSFKDAEQITPLQFRKRGLTL